MESRIPLCACGYLMRIQPDDKKNGELLHVCGYCGHTQSAQGLLFERQSGKSVQTIEPVHPHIKYAATLPHFTIDCPKSGCKNKDAIGQQIDEASMIFRYYCTKCGTEWTNRQEVS
jgi:DNA-directed RNA polymerase subunit M/transcription elongation factor TFIIS